MSVFSDMLKNFVHEKDINVAALAHYCELERSTVYKFINGKREPMSAELVDRIAHFLKLTPSEILHLQEAWKMARMGEDVYYTRKSVEHFLCDFPSKSVIPAPVFSSVEDIVTPSFSSGSNCVLLNSRQAMDSAVHRILLKEAGKANGRIALFVQPDFSFLFRLLSSIQPCESLEIQHIFSLNHTSQFTDHHELYQLYYLRNLFPIYMNDLDYHTYCFYDNEDFHYQNLTVFPYMILTSESAITCSADYQMGIFYHDTDILQALWELFISHRDRCLPLFKKIPISENSPSDVSQFLNTSQVNDDSMIGIQPEACLTPFLQGDLLQAVFNHELPHADMILPAAQAMFAKNAQKIADGKFIIYFTEYGLVHFQQNGTFDEIPEAFYHPLTIPQRIDVLQKVSGCCRMGSYRILKKPLNHLSQNLHLCLRGNDSFLTYQTNLGNTVCLAIYESSLSQVFQDFLEHLDDNIYYTPDEAEKIIASLIQQLETCHFSS